MPDTYPEIEQLLVDTFSLWDVRRIGFSWRKYYLDHTRQVLGLSLRMARAMDADSEQLRFAAILHDITKRYDGEILKDAQGGVVRDDEGFWLNRTVRPDRSNWVSEQYDRLGLSGRIHHVSGAVLAASVLREFGHPESFVRPVAKIVRGHLKGRVPPDVHDERYREPEVRILYDADTIDPNVGLTAFYRNIQIHAGAALQRGERIDLRRYVEGLPAWLDRKESFRDEMLTELGRQICDERQQRNREVARALAEELEEEPVHRRYGLLGVLAELFTNAEDPSLHEHAAGLRERWLPERERLLAREEGRERELGEAALARSRRFVALLEAEIAGEA